MSAAPVAAKLDELASVIRAASGRIAVDAVKAGHALIEAKALLPHGAWLPWLRQHCALDERTAQRYMARAEASSEIRHLSDLIKDDYGTKDWLVELKRTALGGTIDLDPCSNVIAQRTVRAVVYHTKEDDGLTKQWSGTVHLNPPFSDPLPWVRTLIRHWQAGDVTAADVIIPTDHSTEWYQLLLTHGTCFCLPRQRTLYTHPDGRIGSPNFCSSLFYFGQDADLFRQLFGALGKVVAL